MSAKNGLKVYNHEPDMELTELEGNLISKNIVFCFRNFTLDDLHGDIDRLDKCSELSINYYDMVIFMLKMGQIQEL